MVRHIFIITLFIHASPLYGILSAQAPMERAKVILLRTATLFNSETGTFEKGRDILVKGGLIESVGSNLVAPADAPVIDLRGYTVLPGLIDAHTHLLYSEKPGEGLTQGGIKAITMEGEPLRALHGAARARSYLHAGFTTVRDLGNSGKFIDVALKRAIEDGSVEGPRMFVSGPGLATEVGQFFGIQFEHRTIAKEEYRSLQGVDDAVAAVTEAISYGADLVKLYAQVPLEWAKAITERARFVRSFNPGLRTFKVTAHAYNDFATRVMIEAGVDCIEHGYNLSDSTLLLMQKKNIALVPTYLADTASSLRHWNRVRQLQGEPPITMADVIKSFQQPREYLARAMKSGVLIAFGSDAYQDLGSPVVEQALSALLGYAEAGMPNAQALQMATHNGARLIGLENSLGVIKPGAFADIIAVEGNPGSDIHTLKRIRFVMKNGTVYVNVP
jgi:imidazolonepropionase-like amidohydrolase